MQTQFYAWLLKRVIPYVRFTTYYTSMRGWKYRRGYKLLQTGDILLALDRKKLTTLLIPGEFSHAALCINKGSDFEVAEMTHQDFTRSTFFDICKEADRVVLLRCPAWDEDYLKTVIGNCLTFADCHYDYLFTLGVKSLYCSELVYQSDIENRIGARLDDLAGLGRPYISPTGLYKTMERGSTILIWDSDKEIK